MIPDVRPFAGNIYPQPIEKHNQDNNLGLTQITQDHASRYQQGINGPEIEFKHSLVSSTKTAAIGV